MMLHSSSFFKFWISCQDAQKLNKTEFVLYFIIIIIIIIIIITAPRCLSCERDWLLLQLLKVAKNLTLSVVIITIFPFNH